MKQTHFSNLILLGYNSPSQAKFNQHKAKKTRQIIPHKHLTITIHTLKALHHRSAYKAFIIPKGITTTIAELQQPFGPLTIMGK